MGVIGLGRGRGRGFARERVGDDDDDDDVVMGRFEREEIQELGLDSGALDCEDGSR